MLPEFVFHLDELKGSYLASFQAVNVTKLKLCGFEQVKSVEEVQRIKLVGKQGLKELTLQRLFPNRVLEDNEMLGSLMPPSTIETLKLFGYNSAIFPYWLMDIPPYNFPNLVNISLCRLDNCTSLPPLGQLLNLKNLELKQMEAVAKIDEEFCGAAVAFPCLENFSLRSMPNLEVWNTTYSYRGDGVNRYMFPCLRILDIESCPKLRLEPCPPKAEDWIIRRSDGVISSSWGECVTRQCF